MGEEEPLAFCQCGMLSIQTPDEADERACAVVRGEHGRRILAPQRVVRVIFERLREEAPVHVEKR